MKTRLSGLLYIFIIIVLVLVATACSKPEAQQPVIQSFNVVHTAIVQGECATVSWITGGGTRRVQLLRDDEVILDNAPLENSMEECPPQSAWTTLRYTLIASNDAGQQVDRWVTVRVGTEPPQNVLANTSWQVQSMQEIGDVPAEVSITAYFGEDDSITGNSGCNSYTVSYVCNGEEIIINLPAKTGEKVCGEPEDSLEQAYLRLLPQTANYLIVEGQLILLNNTGQETLRFNPME